MEGPDEGTHLGSKAIQWASGRADCTPAQVNSETNIIPAPTVAATAMTVKVAQNSVGRS